MPVISTFQGYMNLEPKALLQTDKFAELQIFVNWIDKTKKSLSDISIKKLDWMRGFSCAAGDKCQYFRRSKLKKELIEPYQWVASRFEQLHYYLKF